MKKWIIVAAVLFGSSLVASASCWCYAPQGCRCIVTNGTCVVQC